jgi:hypothetical protein
MKIDRKLRFKKKIYGSPRLTLPDSKFMRLRGDEKEVAEEEEEGGGMKRTRGCPRMERIKNFFVHLTRNFIPVYALPLSFYFSSSR